MRKCGVQRIGQLVRGVAGAGPVVVEVQRRAVVDQVQAAVEHWRQIVANFRMFGVRQQISLSLFTEFGDNGLQLEERREGELTTLVEQLTDATRKFVLADELAGLLRQPSPGIRVIRVPVSGSGRRAAGQRVRAAVAAALGDLVERGSDSELMKRLRGA